MESGYVTTGARVYWRSWTAKWWPFYFDALRGTRPAFVGANRLSGYHCHRCELILFRYGSQKHAYAPAKPD